MAAKKSAKKSAKKAASKKKAAAPKKKAAKKAAKKATAKDAEPPAEPPVEAPVEAPVDAPVEATVGAPAGAPVEELVKAVVKAAAKAVEVEDEEPERPAPKPIPKMPARRKDGVITLAYGPEADAAFMVFALATGKVDTEGRAYALVRKHVQALDDEAAKAVYDVTTMSFGVYPSVDDRYMLLPCGCSFGDQRGPLLVSRSHIRSNEVQGLQVAVPGEHSTGALALRLWLPTASFELMPMPARQVSLMVRANQARSGILVTEDQFTYGNNNLMRVVDLGLWWGEETDGLPLPLTAAGIRRDIEEEERGKIALDLKRSIAYALGHREEALEWAMQFARKVDNDALERFVDRYVNDLSLDCGERGRQAVQLFFEQTYDAGLFSEPVYPIYHGQEDA